MEAIVCQAVEAKVIEIAADAQVKVEALNALTSAEMSFVGGGLCVAFV